LFQHGFPGGEKLGGCDEYISVKILCILVTVGLIGKGQKQIPGAKGKATTVTKYRGGASYHIHKLNGIMKMKGEVQSVLMDEPCRLSLFIKWVHTITSAQIYYNIALII
jgi:hypothetical protein